METRIILHFASPVSNPQLSTASPTFAIACEFMRVFVQNTTSAKFFVMGVPYSQEIRAAVDQVTALVAAVQTTKNIFILLAAVQVIKVVLLALILLVTLALLITVNPDLEDERAAVVTPVMKWIIHRLSNFFPAMHSQKDLERRKADRI